MLKRHLFSLTTSTALVFFFFFPALASDILWSRTYGDSSGEHCYCVQQTDDGGYIMAGERRSFGNVDVGLVETDSDGNTLWTRTYGGSNDEESYSVQQTQDGGYIIVGYTRSFGAGGMDVYLIKTNSLGDTLWSRTYGTPGDEIGFSLQETEGGGYIVAGYTLGAEGRDVYLIKTDSLGDTVWCRAYGGAGGETGYCVRQTADGGYIVTGGTAPAAGEADVFLVKIDSDGDLLWTRAYGGNRSEDARSIWQTTEGGYIVAGGTNSFGIGEYDLYLIRVGSGGDTLWSRAYGGGGFDFGLSVQQTAGYGYVVAGVTYSFGADTGDVYVIKTDSIGDISWARSYGRSGGYTKDRGESVQQATDGGIIVAGGTCPIASDDWDFMLTKFDSLGNGCIGDFVSSTVTSATCTVTSPTWEVNIPSTVVTIPATVVSSPPIEVMVLCERVCGDVNDDSLVGLGDIVYLINYLYRGGDPPVAGDVTCDETSNIGDVVHLINYLFRNGPPPCC